MSKIIGKPLKNIPWQDRPAGSDKVVWRYDANPIIKRDQLPTSNSIFNSAVVPFEDGFAGVFRCDDNRRFCRVHAGKSKDGINWDINPTPIEFECDIEGIEYEYSYDPRVCFIEDRWYVTWCNGYHGPTIGVAYTYDFETFTQCENAFLPYNRNGVLFPKKINGNFAMYSRPSDDRHTEFGDMFYSESPDMEYWGRHRFVMTTTMGWQSTKIGAGPNPIELDDGWLVIYHGVSTSCSGMVYSMGAAIMDKEKPWIVKYRTSPYLLCPQELYECVGDVPNVLFPCSALCDAETGRITIYYGGADTVTCMAFTQLDELVEYIKNNSL